MFSPRILTILLLLFIAINSNLSAQQSTTGPVPPPGTDRGLMPTTRSQFVIPDVPAYIWKHGCGPTAVGMVIGFWDMVGPDLVPGDASTQTPAVNAMIAYDSNHPICGQPYSDHYQDYACPIDYSPALYTDRSETGGAHADNCVADYMKTSQSLYSNRYGWSWFSDIPAGFLGYVNQAAPGITPVVNNYDYWGFSFENYKNQIDQMRPVVLLVDTDGDGSTDHFVAGIGYDDVAMTYGIRDTWDQGIHWYAWREIGAGVTWGIYGVTTFGGIDWTKPYVVLDSAQFLNSSGDAFNDIGDTIQVYLYLKNYGQDANNTLITLSSNDPAIIFHTQSIYFEVIPGSGAQTNNLGIPLEYIIPDLGNPSYDSIYVTINSDDSAYIKTFGFEEIVGRARVLIVDDDRGFYYENIYWGDLYQKDVPAHVHEKLIEGSPSLSLMSQYNTVIWYTGDSTLDFLQPEDISVMKDYLDGGGNLFLTGQGLAGELNTEDPDFLANYIHAGYGGVNFWYIHNGVAGSPIGDGLHIRYYSGSNQAFNLSQKINALEGAVPAFQFANTGGGYSALSYAGDYKVVFFTFGYEAIANDLPNYDYRDVVISRVLSFLDAWAVPPCHDSDNDGFGDPGHPENACETDNCPYAYNPDQADGDGDGVGDACDNCPSINNTSQTNSDGDIFGDVCDNCPFAINNDQVNSDGDSHGDSCDNCIHVNNEDQADANSNGIGDVCEYICGDANGSATINILDVTFLINYLYKAGPPPDPQESGDANGNGSINLLDVTYLIGYLYKGGPAPMCP
ncbi:MAG: hypothetical protein CVT49_06770 [candidate division Zixibacteria bacterium HGW-Zixibacteria-1]|nr:MAG: hypothetical protein CVT49_06770 [candidate division Zixibacteria bacterium HGW-Zixibacteria-1]